MNNQYSIAGELSNRKKDHTNVLEIQSKIVNLHSQI